MRAPLAAAAVLVLLATAGGCGGGSAITGDERRALAERIADAREARASYRAGTVVPTSGVAHGLVQANLNAVPADWAFETLLFAQRNPKPMPVLEVLEAGRRSATRMGSLLADVIAGL